MPVYKTEAIVIRRVNLGEADRLVTLFCRDHGKVSAAAKGARKPKSRFAGRLELFSHVRMLLAVGRTLDVVSQVEVVDAFAGLRTDLDRLGHASFAAELVDRATADRESAPEIFKSLRTALELMQTLDPESVALWFTGQVLVHSGYGPVTDHCQVCGAPVREGAVFSDALGGALCATDRHRDPGAAVVSTVTLRAVGELLLAPPAALGRAVQGARARSDVGTLLRRYAEYRLETTLKSPRVIQTLSRTGTRERGNRGT